MPLLVQLDFRGPPCLFVPESCHHIFFSRCLVSGKSVRSLRLGRQRFVECDDLVSWHAHLSSCAYDLHVVLVQPLFLGFGFSLHLFTPVAESDGVLAGLTTVIANRCLAKSCSGNSA